MDEEWSLTEVILTRQVVELEEEERTALDGALEAERRNLWCYDTDERGLRTADLVGKVRYTTPAGGRG